MQKLGFLLVCLVLTAFCKANIITVDNDGPADFNNIQAAVNAARGGDVIIVADGIYVGAGNRDIVIPPKTITVRSENGPQFCIIDCQGTYADNHRGFYFQDSVPGPFPDPVVNGFTIINGFIVTGYEGGAGIKCYNSSPTNN